MAFESGWTAGNHPPPGELLVAWENQLPREQAAPILAHIQQCWECRARVERYARGIDAYVNFRQVYLDPALTPRPGGWLRLAARVRDIPDNQAAARRTLRTRIPRGVWVAVPALLAALVVIAVIVSPVRLTASVVLDRAVRAETAQPSRPAPRVRIRRAGRLIAADERVLQAAHVDGSRPLSVNSFRTWRDGLRSRQDSVTTFDGEIRVETKTDEGTIALASLTVARTDYQPHAKHVELRDGVTIDVESADSSPEHETLPEVTAQPGEAPTPAANPGPDAEKREALEMEVRWALHRIGADLGEPVTIRQSGESLSVAGTLDDPGRRDQVVAALRGFPQVSVQINVAAPDAQAPAHAEPIEPSSGAAPGPLLVPRLLNDLPDPAARAAFVSAALRLSQSMLRHSWALRRLAVRYPSPTENALPAEVRASLAQLVAAHQEDLRSSAREAASLWKPYAQFDAVETGARLNWQDASRAVLRAAQRSDHLTVRLLTASGNDGLTAADALEGLRESQRQLLATLAGVHP